MVRYEKWLGAGLGFAVAGPLGGVVGFLAGNLWERSRGNKTDLQQEGVTELEVNIMIVSAHLARIDSVVNHREINFVTRFLNTHFNEKYAAQREQIFNHCLQKEYDLTVACDQLRMYTPHHTRLQIVRFLLELALADGEISEREHYFIFKVAGFINVNDVAYRTIKKEVEEAGPQMSVYDLLGVTPNTPFAQIRTKYRALILQSHPDRHPNATEQERKELSLKFQQIQQAYAEIKALHEK